MESHTSICTCGFIYVDIKCVVCMCVCPCTRYIQANGNLANNTIR